MKSFFQSILAIIVLTACTGSFTLKDPFSFIQVNAPDGNFLGEEQESHFVFKGIP